MSLEWYELVMLSMVGMAAGWTNTMAGGGSLLTVPAMLFMGIPAPIANGTNRIAILAQTISAMTVFFRRGFSDIKLSLSLSLIACIGSVAGSFVGIQLSGQVFDWLLGTTMILVLYLMITDKGQGSSTNEENEQPKRLVLGHILMIAAGFWGGMIQVGTGILLLMPILHNVMGMNLVTANIHKSFIALNFTIVSLAIYASQLELLWIVGLALAIGNSIGGWLGAHTSLNKGDIWIKRVIYIVLAAFAIKLIFL